MKQRIFIIPMAALLLLAGCAGGLRLLSGAESEFDAGLELFNKGIYSEAAVRFAKATEIDPEFGKAYLYLGRSYLNLGRYAQAVTSLRTAYRLAPSETRSQVLDLLIDAFMGLGGQELRKGNFQGAVNSFKEALDLAPGSGYITGELVTALIGYGRDLLAAGKVNEAISTFLEAVRLSPGNGAAYLGLAKSFFESGDLLKALSSAEKAMELDPSSGEARALMNLLRSPQKEKDQPAPRGGPNDLLLP